MMGGSETGLGTELDPTFNISPQASLWRAAWSVACTIISIVFGGYTIAILFRRPWRPTLVFIIILLISDWFKAFWQFTYSVYWLVYRPSGLQEDNDWCQAEGFFFAWAVEMSDCTLSAMLIYVVFGVATRLHRSSAAVKMAFSWIGYFLWFGVPILAAGLAFINDSGYTNQSTSCYLPVRPFWYRLGLSWIPRYFMLFSSSAAILWLFVYVRSRHRSFMVLLRRPDEESSSARIPGNKPPTGSSRRSMPPSDIVGRDLYSPQLQSPLQSPLRSPLQSPLPDLRTHAVSGAGDAPKTFASTETGYDSMATDSVTNSADEVLRRLRRLWVYPLVYFLYWTLPFVYHAMTYKMYFVLHPVPALAGLSSTILALHCTFMSAAVWIFERLGDKADVQNRVSVWRHIRDALRPAKFFASSQWEKSAEQRQSAFMAQQRLAIEQEERRGQRTRQSAMSSHANLNFRDSLFVDDPDFRIPEEQRINDDGTKDVESRLHDSRTDHG